MIEITVVNWNGTVLRADTCAPGAWEYLMLCGRVMEENEDVLAKVITEAAVWGRAAIFMDENGRLALY